MAGKICQALVGGALTAGLYGVVLERIYRESPGWTWMWAGLREVIRYVIHHI